MKNIQIGYAYATSTTAEKLGHAKTGCYFFQDGDKKPEFIGTDCKALASYIAGYDVYITRDSLAWAAPILAHHFAKTVRAVA